jgi:hypothetical protein
VNLAPYIGAKGSGTTCDTECFNSGGSPTGRTPSCTGSLDTFTHPTQETGNWSAPYYPTACGLYNRFLNKKTGVAAKYPHLRWVLSVGGWYDERPPPPPPPPRRGLVKPPTRNHDWCYRIPYYRTDDQRAAIAAR